MTEYLPEVMRYLIGGAAVYAAIRADLVAAKMRAEQAAHDACQAHKRIDEHINFHVQKD